MNCLKMCPEYTVEYNHTCLMECPSNVSFVTFYDCDEFCSNSRKVCSKSCSVTHPYVMQTDNSIRCMQYCPDYTEQISKNKSCNLKCPSSKPFLFNNTCYRICPYKASFIVLKKSRYNEIFKCEEQCPESTVADHNRCVDSCPKGKHLFNNTCVKECPFHHEYMYPKSFRTRNKINSDRAEFSCVDNCNQYDNEKNNNELSYVAFNSIYTDKCPPSAIYEFNQSCFKNCPNEQPFMEKTYRSIKCVDKCKHLHYNKTCVSHCPAYAKHAYNGTCLTACPVEHSYLEPTSQHIKCVDKCAILHYQNRCVFKCPSNARYEFNGSCTSTCSNNLYMENSYRSKCVDRCRHLEFNKTCVLACPVHAKYEFDRSCLPSCPLGNSFIVSADLYRCTDKCKQKQLVFNNTCYYNCPQIAKYEFKRSCVASCPDEHPLMEPTKTNTRCTKSCKQLQYENNCVSTCPSFAQFKYNSSCVNECGSHLPFEYYVKTKIKAPVYSWRYKNVVKYKYDYRCVASCPIGTLLYNNSKCVSSCPLDKNVEFNGICFEQCPVSHLYKIRQNDDFTCVKNCSTPLIYNNTCLTKCPKEAEFEVYGSCVVECPQEKQFKELTNRKTYHCAGSCSRLYFDTTCVSLCPPEAKFQYKWSCVKTCEKDLPYAYFNTRVYPIEYKCVKTCPSNTWLYNKTDCVFVCPETARYHDDDSCVNECDNIRPYTYMEDSKWYCEQKCPRNTFNFNMSCVTKCLSNTFSFDLKCMSLCPSSHPMNFTRNKKGFGIYECVNKCSHEKFMYNKTCFDVCPGEMKGHLYSCINICPHSHPITEVQSQTCVSVCPKTTVLVDNHSCVDTCPYGSLYIEDQRCVKRCKSYDAVIESTIQGKKCHDKSPSHLFLDDLRNSCVDICSNGLIVDNICKDIEKCPFHKFIEHSLLGRRCTNRCSKNFFLDGTNCVKECPREKVTADKECLNACPPSLPIRYNDFLKSEITCYKECPSNYVANGTKCIWDFECDNGYFIFQKICLNVCPQWTVTSGESCHPLIIYIIMTISSVVLTVVALVILCAIIFYRGSSYTDCKMLFCRFQSRAEVSYNVGTTFTLKELTETDVTEDTEAECRV
ncbi:Hypothetical predicted protein [Mytilus galloprovincialis]|uniref:Uncharacterized protein n=1 Tax=Mytilus galloprovincialis TaxID=29158 RepID=A0A8B6FR12_MYTGA|nr:Hypothetical predicted protein [Mytilus galloprovincialis]